MVQRFGRGTKVAEQLVAGNAGQSLALALLIALPERHFGPVGNNQQASRALLEDFEMSQRRIVHGIQPVKHLRLAMLVRAGEAKEILDLPCFVTWSNCLPNFRLRSAADVFDKTVARKQPFAPGSTTRETTLVITLQG